MNITEVAALIYVVASGIVVVFQCLLALGAPWGAYTMGGSHPGRLPAAMRVMAAIQAVILGLLALVVLSRAGLTSRDQTVGPTWLIWIAVAVSALSVVMNAASRSSKERRLWVPVGVVMLGSSLVVALRTS
jgi:hypothetical protein